MIEALHLSSLLPAAVGACCTLGDRRARSAVTWVPALVMLVAMLDVALGWGIGHPVAWAAALVALSVWPVVAHRLSRAAAGADMAVHRSLGLLVMAGLLVGHVETIGHHSLGSGPGIAAVAAYLGFTLWLVAHLSRRPQRVRIIPMIETVSMGLSVALMSGAMS